MSNIKITIAEVDKEYEPLTNNEGILPNPDQLINIKGQWYREVEPAKQDYEILSFREISGIAIWGKAADGKYKSGYSHSDNSLTEMIKHQKDDIVSIHSVKRLTDGEVFTVGDNIKDMGVITSFVLTLNSNIKVYSNERMEYYEDIEKVVTPPILLTTEEGDKITDGEQVLYGIDKVFNGFYKTTAKNCNNKDVKYFSTEAARGGYTLLNNPITVTYAELTNLIKFSQTQHKLFIEFFKSKQK